jgi:hypothetical protein
MTESPPTEEELEKMGVVFALDPDEPLVLS